MNLKLTMNKAQWDAAERALKGFSKGVGTAAARAINRTLITGRKFADLEIRKDHTLSSTALKGQIKLYNASPRYGRTSGTMELSYRPFPVYKFFRVKPRTPYHQLQRKPPAGAQVMVRKSGGYKVIPHTFVAQMKSGHLGLFSRYKSGWSEAGRGGASVFSPITVKERRVEHWVQYGRGGAKTHVSTYKSERIYEIYGPSVAGMARTADVYPVVEREMQSMLQKRFLAEVTHLLDKGR